MTCPDCIDGEIYAYHVLYTDGTSGWGKVFPCHRCNGTGEVPEEQREWRKQGQRMKRFRLGVLKTGMREEAERRGILPSDYSSMERGIIQPAFPAGFH